MIKKCIVTGGAGFIGSHLVDALLQEKYHVTVLDNLHVGRKENLSHALSLPNCEFYQVDIRDKSSLEPYIKNVDYIFHLAALADIVPSITNPVDYMETNVTGTMNVLECVRQYCPTIKKVVYIASSSCYGISDIYPTPETARIQPQYPYALSKFLGEQTVLHWHQVYGLPIISLRLFNVYGPRARTSGSYGAVFGVFLAQKLAEKPLTVVGDGEQLRDFTYVTDVVSAIQHAAKSAVVGDYYNVGSGGCYSINQLVSLLNTDVTYIPKRPGEPDQTFADISKINTHLHWQPKISFEQGVHQLLSELSCFHDAPVWTSDAIACATTEWFHYLGEK